MMLRPFFPYFGGKWRIAPKYPAPRFSIIVEPFAGSAGYALRYPDRQVFLNDVDERVSGTWDYLIRSSQEELARLPLYDGTWDNVDSLHIPQEAKWLIGWWLNKGAGGKSPSKWMRETWAGHGSMGENYWGEGIRNRLVRQSPFIRHWKVECGGYRAFDAMLGSQKDVTWFVDPPYKRAGKGYRYGSQGVDYEELAQWVRMREGQVIVCENEGAVWLPFSDFVVAKGTEGRYRSGKSKEVVWLSGTLTDDLL